MLDDYAARLLPRRRRRVGRELLIAAMDDHLLDTHALKRPRTVTRRLLGTAATSYVRARGSLPDPGDRSRTDTYSGSYGPCPHPTALGPEPSVASALR